MIKKNILLAFAIVYSLAGFSQQKNFIDQPYIETNAQVDTLITPDRIYLSILVMEKDTKGKTSVEELESKMESTLKRLGINTKENLTLNDLASNFKKYFLKQQDVHKSKAYTLMVNDAQTAGKVIIALEKIDISNVSFDRTEYSKMEDLQLILKSKAVAKAKKQAEYMVSPLGQKVGPAIFISGQSNNNYLQGRASGLQIRGYEADQEKQFKPADIEFQKIKVESRVAVKFKLEL
jgi:uncharacterized protein YggE